MRGTTFTSAGHFFVESCFSCQVPFAITKEFEEQRRNDGKGFYCPNGHCQSYCESTVKQLREANDRLARERACHDQTKAALEHTERQRRAYLGANTKIKNRIAAGVCPCCRRTFVDLAKHMAGKHPKFCEVNR